MSYGIPPLPPVSGILGVGFDQVDLERIKDVVERQKERFLERVYTSEELAYCLSHRNPIPSLAARFAAKEAISKCFGTGIGGEFGWHSASIGKDGQGQPIVTLDPQGAALLSRRGGSTVLVSLSHSRTLAGAIALLVASGSAESIHE